MEQISAYIYSVYEKQSFSKAAKALFISQPALSAAVARRESELGFRIFDRTTVPISLTAEGRLYIEMLEEIAQSEQAMRRRLQRLAQGSYGSVKVGGASYTAMQLLPIVCGVFHSRYPDVELRVDLGYVGSIDNLSEKLHKQQLDVHFVYRYNPQTERCVPILTEQLVIAMHSSIGEQLGLSHLAISAEELLTHSYTSAQELSDLSIFREVPFLYFGKNTNTSRYMEALLGEYKTANCSIENARHSGVHYRMMCAGVGALMTTDFAVATSAMPTEELLFFVPAGENARRVLYAAQRKNAPIDPVVERFLAVAREVAAKGPIALGKSCVREG